MYNLNYQKLPFKILNEKYKFAPTYSLKTFYTIIYTHTHIDIYVVDLAFKYTVLLDGILTVNFFC